MQATEILSAAQACVRMDALDDAQTLLEALGDLPIPRLWALRADLHRERCEPEAAIAALDRAIAHGAGDWARLRQALMWSPILGDPGVLEKERARCEALLEACESRVLHLDDPVRDLPWLDFYLAYRGMDDRVFRERLGRILRRAAPSLSFEAPHVARGPSPRGKVRLGICSAHLRDHTIGRLNQALIHRLSEFGFHIVLAHVDPPRDAFAEALGASADEVIVTGRALGTAHARLAAAELDVLHYPDLGMDPFTTWLSFARLAPVQTVSWGHPITSGLKTIDAFLASSFLVPRHASDAFTERVLRLPDPMVCWTPPEAPPALARSHFGLPEARPVYLVPQSVFKLHPDFDPVLRSIARGHPEAVIALLAPRRSHWKRSIEQRLGLPPDRLIWVARQPRPGFLELLRTADVVLDPFPFGGGHTSLEAFAMGTPIVTRATRQLRGRLTACWYRTMHLHDWIARDEADYVKRALAWGRDPAARAAAARTLHERTPRLFDREDAVAAHAAAFHGLVEAARGGGRLARVG